MNNKEFRHYLHLFSDWIADYFENTTTYPVNSSLSPGDIKKDLPLVFPNKGEEMENIFNDFKNIIMPGITHWQHPSFFAYFPASRSEPSVHFTINEKGFSGKERYRVYASTQVHSSLDKAIRISGIGHENLVKIPVTGSFSMDTNALEKAIQQDIKNGFHPLAVIATFGTTSSTAIDPMEEIGNLAQKYNIWYHIDAAYGGAALLLPEYRPLAKGIEMADTIVFNPHKWLFTNFDCTVYLVKEKDTLVNTFSIMPEYLKTPEDKLVNNYRDWGIQLGRRFRALKLWFVIRSYGLEGLQQKLRDHIQWVHWFEYQVNQTVDFETLATVTFSLVCFRYKPERALTEEELNTLNRNLLATLNKSGQIFLTHTVLNNSFTLRLVIGNTSVTKESVEEAWKLITAVARGMEIEK